MSSRPRRDMPSDPGRHWREGDRVVWVHEEQDWSRRGGPYAEVRTAGTVTGVDPREGRSDGVHVVFDEPTRYGAVGCFGLATEFELLPKDAH